MAAPVADYYGCPAGQVIAGGRQYMSAFWRNLSPGWTEIELTGTKPGGGIVAYSGMTIDEAGGKLFLFGGGHNDYSGNDVWELDLETRSAWEQHYVGDLGVNPSEAAAQAVTDNTNWPGAIVIEGVAVRPISRHTHKSVHWIKSLGELVAGGTSTYSGSGEYLWAIWLNDPHDFWAYNPASKSWTYKGSSRLNAAYDIGGSITVYHEGRDRLFSPGADANSRLTMRVWNPSANTWTLLSGYAAGSSVSSVSICVDTRRDRLLLVVKDSVSGNAEVWAYDIDANTWEKLTSSGAVPTGYYEQHQVIYSPDSDRLLMVRDTASGLSIYDLATGVWGSEAFPGSVDNLVHVVGCYAYDKRRKAAVLVYNHYAQGLRVFAYKESV